MMANFRICLVVVVLFGNAITFTNCENPDGSFKGSKDQEITEKSSSSAILDAIQQPKPTQQIIRVPESPSSSSHENHFTITTQSPPEETTSASAAKPVLTTLSDFENSVKIESDIMRKDIPPLQQHGGDSNVPKDYFVPEASTRSTNEPTQGTVEHSMNEETENQRNQSLYAATNQANTQSAYYAQVMAKGNERVSEKDGSGHSHDADISAAYHPVTEMVKTSDSNSYRRGSQNESHQFSPEPTSVKPSLPTGETAPVPQSEQPKATSHQAETNEAIGETHPSNKTSASDITTTKSTEVRASMEAEVDARANETILEATTLPLPSEPIEIISKDDQSSDTSIGSTMLSTPSQIDKSESTQKDGLTSSSATEQHIPIKPTDDTISTTALNESSIKLVTPVHNVTLKSSSPGTPSTTEKSLSDQADNTTESSPSVHQFFMDLRTHTVLCLVSILLLLLAGTIVFSIILAIYLTFKYCGIGSAMLARKMSKCIGKKRRGSSHSSANQDSGSLFPRCDVTLRPYILNNHDSL